MDEQPQAQPQVEYSESIIEEKPNRLKRFIKETVRVLRVTKKPNKQEYWTTVKVTGIGIGILGALGFIIFLMKELLI